MTEQPNFEAVRTYWDSVPATVEGVLGGYDGRTPRIDEVSSRLFLLRLKPSLSTIVPPHKTNAPKRKRKITKTLDAGAGIGRVTGKTLLPLFDRVDLIETSTHFLDKAVENSSDWPGIADQSKGVRFFNCGMQDFDPLSPPLDRLHAQKGAQSDWDAKYDVIWLQWCVVHLTDEQLLGFLKRCKAALSTETPDGAYVILKDNVARETAVWDESDNSIMRTDSEYKALFRQAGLTVIKEEVQTNLPAELLPVKTCVFPFLGFTLASKPNA
jgi:protein N-terminal methyltransferase